MTKHWDDAGDINAANGQAGGNGGFPSGGGAGGGGCNTGFISGKGGDGGAGRVVVVCS